jgi:enoyl-CoA hydratase/carnithine racemase
MDIVCSRVPLAVVLAGLGHAIAGVAIVSMAQLGERWQRRCEVGALDESPVRPDHVAVSREPPAARLRLNRPDKRNALSLALMGELIASLQHLARDPDIRAIVVEGAGPVFSAGHDLGELQGRDVGFYQEVFDVCTQLMETIHQVPQPVIAKVHGVATAAGCQLVASCDLAVAAESARFATPGVRIGLFCSTPMVPVSRAVGRKRAMEMLLTGDMIDAKTALDWGLVNRVVPDDALEGEVAALVERVAKASPLTVAIGKEAFYAQVDLPEGEAYDLTKAVMTRNALTGDAQEGIGAFLEKRAPEWRGR